MHVTSIFYIKHKRTIRNSRTVSLVNAEKGKISVKKTSCCQMCDSKFFNLNTEKLIKKILLIDRKLKMLPSLSFNTERISGLSCRSGDIYSLRCLPQISGKPDGVAVTGPSGKWECLICKK